MLETCTANLLSHSYAGGRCGEARSGAEIALLADVLGTEKALQASAEVVYFVQEQ